MKAITMVGMLFLPSIIVVVSRMSLCLLKLTLSYLQLLLSYYLSYLIYRLIYVENAAFKYY
jgi:hypothetical protein